MPGNSLGEGLMLPGVKSSGDLIYSEEDLVIPGNSRGFNVKTLGPLLEGVWVIMLPGVKTSGGLISSGGYLVKQENSTGVVSVTGVSRKNYKKISHNHVFRPNHWSLMGQSDLSYDLPFDHYQARNFILSKKISGISNIPAALHSPLTIVHQIRATTYGLDATEPQTKIYKRQSSKFDKIFEFESMFRVDR
ncbi:hypothetical protein J6590_096109 [Homalodisca vitripennis]|nr:hypothetical protein J6590_096109 [Homalodisca vitripennis]